MDTTTIDLPTTVAAETLPELSAMDRVALKAGLRLLLWTERDRARRAARAERTERARTSGAQERAGDDALRTFEHRRAAGTAW